MRSPECTTAAAGIWRSNEGKIIVAARDERMDEDVYDCEGLNLERRDRLLVRRARRRRASGSESDEDRIERLLTLVDVRIPHVPR